MGKEWEEGEEENYRKNENKWKKIELLLTTADAICFSFWLICNKIIPVGSVHKAKSHFSFFNLFPVERKKFIYI